MIRACLKMQLAAFLIMASFFVSPASAATLTATPSNVSPGGVTSVSWTGGGTARDWIALFPAGAGNGSYLSWAYVSCSPTPTVAFASGSCFFALPNTTGNYEFRFFYNDGFTLLASTSVTVSSLPVVSFSVAGASVLENNTASQARLVVSRTGSTAGSMLVNYTVSGGSNGATAGTDYNTLPGSVTIQPGSSTANIDIVPINDGSAEGDETVVVTLVASAGVYTLGSPGVGTATIQDDEPPLPSVTIAATDNQATEGTPATDTGSFTITRTGSTAAPMVVNFALAGTAVAADYNLSSTATLTVTTVTIPAGSTSAAITLTPVDDTANEGNETAVMTLATNPGVYTIGAPSSATVTIVDNDAPAGPSLVASPSGVAPGTGVTVSWSGLTSPTARDWIGLYNNPGASNASFIGWSYVSCFQSPVVPVASGACSFGLPSTVGTYEFRLFFNDGFTRLATSNPVTVSSLPVVSFSVASASVLENNTASQARLVVSRTGSTAGSMVVNYTVSGTATVVSDYNTLPGSVTIAAGSSTANIDIMPQNDSAVEGDETVVVTLVANAGVYTVGTPGVGTATIQDDEPPLPSVTIAATDNTATEGTPATDTGSFTITRTGSTAASMVVNFTLAGTAVAADYNLSSTATLTATTVTIPAGSSSAAITLTPVDDTANEGNETAVMTLGTNPGVYTIGAPANATITIVDNDAPAGPSLTVNPAAVAPNGTVTASWSGVINATSFDWIALYAVGAGDGSYQSWLYDSSCTQSAGIARTSGSCSYTAPAAGGNYELRLFSNNGYSRIATSNVFTVATLPVVTIVATDNTATEGTPATDTGSYTITRTGSTAAPMVVNFTLSGTAVGADYNLSSTAILTATTVTIPAGSASVVIALTPVDDTANEGNETAVVTLSANAAYTVGAAGSSTVTIVDDEPPLPSVTIAATDNTATEGTPATDTGSYTITRTGSTAAPMVVNFTLSGTAVGADYNLSSTATLTATTVTIPAGSASVVIALTPVNDTANEGNETAVVTLATNPGVYTIGAQSSATVTIVDNDAPAGPSLTVNPAAIAAGSALTANWSGVGNATPRDWIALSALGAPDTSYLAWMYVNCSTSSGASSFPVGSCPFGIPGGIAAGNYQLRLFSNDGYSRLATSNQITVAPLAVVTTALPGGTVDLAYNQTLAASGGTGIYTWSLISGALPSGVSLSPSGIISGTPTVAANSTFTVRVQDSLMASATRALSINVSLDNALVHITTDSLPSGQVILPYSQTMSATGGTAPYTWSLLSGSLPKGLTLSAGGTVSGTPIEIGTARFTVRVQDSLGQADTQPYMLTTLITPGPRTVVGYWSFDDGTAIDDSGMRHDGTLIGGPTAVAGRSGQALNFNGNGQYVNLGSVLDNSSGHLSVFAWVKTTESGFSRMIVAKRDSTLPNNPGWQLFQNSSGRLAFIFGNGVSDAVRVDSTGPQINDGNWHFVGVVFKRSGPGTLYVDGLPAANGSGDITSQDGNVANNLGLRIGAEEGGRYWIGSIDEVRVIGRRIFTDQQVLDMYNQPLNIVANSLPAGAAGATYSQTLTGFGGVWPYAWSIDSGSLPAGVSLAPNGVLSGVPAASGTFNFTVRLDDSALHTVTQPLTLVINSQAPQVLLSENFSGTLANWTIVDEPGTVEGPSVWTIMNGDLVQQTNINGGLFAGGDPVKPGTHALAGSTSWQDYTFSLRTMSEDNDIIGVVFRYQNGQNYYRFSMNNEWSYRRLDKIVNGVTTPIIEDSVPYEIGQSYNMRISVIGSNIKIYADNRLVFDVIDSAHPNGKIGLYTWGNEYGHFGEVLVTSP